jgi:hypothetical protein
MIDSIVINDLPKHNSLNSPTFLKNSQKLEFYKSISGIEKTFYMAFTSFCFLF